MCIILMVTKLRYNEVQLHNIYQWKLNIYF